MIVFVSKTTTPFCYVCTKLQTSNTEAMLQQ